MKPEIQKLIGSTYDLIDQYEKADGDGEKIAQMKRFMSDVEMFTDDVIETICTTISERCLELIGSRDTLPPNTEP